MIDIHTHLLPGVDDGSPSIEVSVPVLERFAADGVDVVVCTPHLTASGAAAAPYDHHLELLRELETAAPATPELRLGWEIMLDRPGVDLRDSRYGLGGSTAVLVEFPRTRVPPGASAEIFRLRMSGVVPVLAHPERYWGCDAAQVREWRQAGAVIQLDVASMLAREEPARVARELLEQGLADCIASDNHGDVRSMRAACEWFEEIGAGEQARLLSHTNPERLLANEPPLPIAPVEPPRGMLGRLRELVLGRRRP